MPVDTIPTTHFAERTSMSTYSVKVQTPDGERHEFDQAAFTSGEAHEAAAARFGYLCSVVVLPV